MNKKRKVKEIKIYLTPMLPTHFSRKQREEIKRKEAEILKPTYQKQLKK